MFLSVFWERERMRMHALQYPCVWEGQSERESKILSRPCTVSPKLSLGLDPTNSEIMTWAYIKNQFKKNFFLLTFIYFLRVRDWARAGEVQREGDVELEACSRLWVVSTEPDGGLEPTNREIMTWAEVSRPTDWATQAPLKSQFLMFIYFWECVYTRQRERERERAREEQKRET